jgi:hypothetical protein
VQLLYANKKKRRKKKKEIPEGAAVEKVGS